jgi:hypothetical protein
MTMYPIDSSRGFLQSTFLIRWNMSSVSLNIKNVALNAGLTVGVAFAAGVITKLVNKVAHDYFNWAISWKNGPSLLIQQGAVIAGSIVGGALALRATPAIFPRDHKFIYSHLGNIGSLFFGVMLSFANEKSIMTRCVVGLSIASMATGAYGSSGLIAAAGIGAVTGLLLSKQPSRFAL